MIWQVLPWVISCLTITAMYLAGNKSRHAWSLGLGNQALWIAWVLHTRSWGLLLTSGALIVLYARNLRKWRAA